MASQETHGAPVDGEAGGRAPIDARPRRWPRPVPARENSSGTHSEVEPGRVHEPWRDGGGERVQLLRRQKRSNGTWAGACGHNIAATLRQPDQRMHEDMKEI